MKKILVLVMMLCVAFTAVAESDLFGFELSEQYMGSVAYAATKDMPLIGIKKGALTIDQDATTVKLTAEAPDALKDGDKIAVAICIPGWEGEAVQGEIVDNQLVFELDEATLEALKSLPDYNDDAIELMFAVFKGELQE